LQQPIIDYLENQKEVNDFFINAKAIVDHSISNYIERNFNNLQINFGCTGGRHRSVFSASKIAEHINNKFPDVNVVIRHMEIDD
jgi:RNase adaptor protein for sRNA GlmZ degradation